jgi:hypothetical protein
MYSTAIIHLESKRWQVSCNSARSFWNQALCGMDMEVTFIAADDLEH